MRRKITVYGLRFSKTSFWNRLNTGFPDPAVATVLTACGIETVENHYHLQGIYELQQYLPLAVLKHLLEKSLAELPPVATVLTACGIETPFKLTPVF